MNKLLKNQLENTQTLESIQMNITRKFRNAVIECILYRLDNGKYVSIIWIGCREFSKCHEVKLLASQIWEIHNSIVLLYGYLTCLTVLLIVSDLD